MCTFILFSPFVFFSFPFFAHSDVLTANDFAGEAFLALGNIPGVADYSTSIENFHGLKQVDLPLMQQNDKSHPILQILESRVSDKQAVEFVRKQKGRLAS